jgi:hypothetical protein
MLTSYIIAALLYSPANPANDVIGYVILPSYYIKFLMLAVNFLLVIMLWRSRKRVARAIWPDLAAVELPQGSIREKFARSCIFLRLPMSSLLEYTGLSTH